MQDVLKDFSSWSDLNAPSNPRGAKALNGRGEWKQEDVVVIVSLVPCALPEEYRCAGNGSWVNELLGAELPKCVPGTRAQAWAETIATGAAAWGPPSKSSCREFLSWLSGNKSD